MHKHRTALLQASEQGFVSIIVCMIIAVIVTIMTIGFTQLMNRERRDALDRQLSTQAFYAAESGINDAVEKLKQDPTYTKTDCIASIVLGTVNVEPQLDSSGSVKATCVLVEQAPDSLVFDSVGTNPNTPYVVPIKPTPDSAVQTISVEWSATGVGTSKFRTPGSPIWPAAKDWGATTGALRITVIPKTNGVTRDEIRNSSRTYFLYPTSGSGGSSVTIDLSTKDDQSIVSVVCASDSNCYANLNLPNSSSAPRDVPLVIMTSLYQTNRVVLRAFAPSALATEQLRLSGVQTVVDSTGRVSDVLRRIQVRIPTIKRYNYPSGPLDTAENSLQSFTSGSCILKQYAFSNPDTNMNTDVTSSDCPL